MEFKDTLRQNLGWIEHYATVQDSEYEEPIPEEIRLKTLVNGIIKFIEDDDETDEKAAYEKKIKAMKKRVSVLSYTHSILGIND